MRMRRGTLKRSILSSTCRSLVLQRISPWRLGRRQTAGLCAVCGRSCPGWTSSAISALAPCGCVAAPRARVANLRGSLPSATARTWSRGNIGWCCLELRTGRRWRGTVPGPTHRMGRCRAFALRLSRLLATLPRVSQHSGLQKTSLQMGQPAAGELLARVGSAGLLAFSVWQGPLQVRCRRPWLRKWLGVAVAPICCRWRRSFARLDQGTCRLWAFATLVPSGLQPSGRCCLAVEGGRGRGGGVGLGTCLA
mmetsp:Transcript_52057/g.163220  ORF Transcript_52057/g.163220 Transcript_52057/m.163220 type:complete len:251 (+) Transcript_52057:885-1637(+)